MTEDDLYISIKEVAALLRCKPKTICNKISSGVFRLGVHYFRPSDFDPLFKKSAVIELIEGRTASGLELDPTKSFTAELNGVNNHERGLRS